jgi:alpha-L-fucosidase 2
MLTASRQLNAPATPTPAGILRYDQPATRWFEALPIGNGRLGAMVDGGVDRERLRLSESTAWSGAPGTDDVSPTARRELPRIRELLFAGQHARAQQAASEHLLGRRDSFGTNLPLPQLVLDFGTAGVVRNYRRQLDLDTALVSVEYQRNGTRFGQEVFASNPHGVIALRLTASRLAAISFKLRFAEATIPGTAIADATGVRWRGRAVESLHSDGQQGTGVEIRAEIVTDGGTTRTHDAAVVVSGANSATVFLAVGTDWAGDDPVNRTRALISEALRAGYADVRTSHVRDHRRLMRRVSIDLGHPPTEVAGLPTDERRRRFAAGGSDDALVALYFQYGRYLTVAGSRANSPLPLALQGIWNDGLASSASWTNDFHLDMNTQQNYWAAEPTNLGECQLSLIRFVERLAEAGRTTAEAHYGAPGWVAHTVTNAWGYTAPGTGIGWGLHVTGGAWLALQLWEHYEYGGRDRQFLRDRLYPVFRGAAEFFLSCLATEPSFGWLVLGPSESPENWYLAPDGARCSVAMGNTVDRVFVEAILRIYAAAAAELGADVVLRERAEAARARLAPFQVGRHGQLQEWLHDFEEADPAHRHTSHLCALYPERQIGPRSTPELAKAAEITIDRRGSAPGWEQTEWVEANFTVYLARLLNGDKALVHLRGLIADTSEANLMSYSAGGVAGAKQNIYSFDGNAGGTAGIAEMLLQSDGTRIELLPALPSSWRDGAVRGLRARGGYTVDISWREGRLTSARIHSSTAATAPVLVRYQDDTVELTLADQETRVLRPE